MTLPDDIAAAVLAYYAACVTDHAAFMAYEAARKGLGEEPDGDALASVEDIGRACDATLDARRAAGAALLQAIECMEVK